MNRTEWLPWVLRTPSRIAHITATACCAVIWYSNAGHPKYGGTADLFLAVAAVSALFAARRNWWTGKAVQRTRARRDPTFGQ